MVYIAAELNQLLWIIQYYKLWFAVQNVDDPKLIACVSKIVTAYLGNNAISIESIRDLITATHCALTSASKDLKSQPKQSTPVPAVSIPQSITSDYLICLDDGLKFKMLKGHLAKLGMTPTQYREKWKLPYDYPMSSPSHSKRRSELSKSWDLGGSIRKVNRL